MDNWHIIINNESNRLQPVDKVGSHVCTQIRMNQWINGTHEEKLGMYIVSKYCLQNIIKYKGGNGNFTGSDTNLGVQTAHHQSWDKWKSGSSGRMWWEESTSSVTLLPKICILSISQKGDIRCTWIEGYAVGSQSIQVRKAENRQTAPSWRRQRAWQLSVTRAFIYLFNKNFFFFYCSGFCPTLKWISHGFTCVPHPDPPSHLPLHPIPLGLPSAPGPSACLMHQTWAGDLFHPR